MVDVVEVRQVVSVVVVEDAGANDILRQISQQRDGLLVQIREVTEHCVSRRERALIRECVGGCGETSRGETLNLVWNFGFHHFFCHIAVKW